MHRLGVTKVVVIVLGSVIAIMYIAQALSDARSGLRDRASARIGDAIAQSSSRNFATEKSGRAGALAVRGCSTVELARLVDGVAISENHLVYENTIYQISGAEFALQSGARRACGISGIHRGARLQVFIIVGCDRDGSC